MSIYTRESGSVVSVTPGVRLRCAITPGVRLRCVITPGVRLRYFSDNRESDSVVSMTKKVVRLDGVIYKLTAKLTIDRHKMFPCNALFEHTAANL